MSKQDVKSLIVDNIMGSQDVQNMLLINRSRLAALIESGKLTPVKELKRENLFWLPDVEKLKQELMLDSRSNLYKKGVTNFVQ